VNEPAAGDQITEVLNDDLHLTDTDNLDGTDDADEEPQTARRTREGLPPSFRMRHDAHYVDDLMSRTVHDTPAAAPERIDSAPAIETSAAPAGAGAALGLIADRLESLVAHQNASRPQFTSPSLIAQSVHVELLRVTRLARASATLQHREPPVRVELSAREIVDTSSRVAAPVARLAGVEFDVSLDDPGFEILAEPSMVVLGLAATVDAVVDMLLADPRRQPAIDRRQPSARISISLQTVRVRPALIIDVCCPTLFVSGAHAGRFFDAAADDYRATPAAGVLLAAAAHIVKAHGGRADVKRHNASGATITYVFPQTP
jgi:hypothetical protein